MARGPPDYGITSIDYTKTIHNLTGKTILITGTAGGIEKAVARSAARAGASHIIVSDVVFCDTLIDELKRAGRCHYHRSQCLQPIAECIRPTSLTSKTLNASAKADMSQLPTGLDIIVNMAGRFEPYIPLLESDPDRYWSAFEVNLKGAINIARAFLPTLLNTIRGLKTLINASSIGALTTRGGGGSYRTTKLGILRFTEFLSNDYAAQGLAAYCVHPGAVATELGLGLPQEMQAVLIDKPALPGDAIVWLAHDRKEWLGGRYVSCTWDMPELVAKREEIVKGDKLKMRMAF
ncbi:putative oxidoreductase [Polychaeton citri CBS 116435]|uniref:Oxidoreductase n=1 Tax=Polychaeton citri CBS 116435 TaxID=1314669 RepID=A0A9P4UKG5_9PEZI|nr:putative oxidoreductase [Polychaeton citri CBS 116435]